MRNLLIVLAISVLALSGCSSSEQPRLASAPSAPSATSAPAVQLGPDLPGSPSLLVAMVDEKVATYISGGWGRSRADAVVFRRGDESYEFVAVEYYLLDGRNYLDLLFTEGCEDYEIVDGRWNFTQSLWNLDGKDYDLLKYSFIAVKPEDVARAKAILAGSASPEEMERQLASFAIIFPREFWFDITAPYAQNYEWLEGVVSKWFEPQS